METFITIIIISAAMLLIGVTKYKDFKNKKENPPKQWEGKRQSEIDQDREKAEKLTEFHKGNGRGGF